MSKLLLFGTYAHGHVNPTLPVVSSLRTFRERIAATGCRFAEYPAYAAAAPDHMQGCFVISAGRSASGLKAPDQFIVRESVPQLDVLREADVFITHAGMDSLQESLYSDVPKIMVPQQVEQLMNACIAERAGAGVLLGARPPYSGRVTAAELRDALENILANSGYAESAARIGRAVRESGGAAEAARLIEEFLVGVGERKDVSRTTD